MGTEENNVTKRREQNKVWVYKAQPIAAESRHKVCLLTLSLLPHTHVSCCSYRLTLFALSYLGNFYRECACVCDTKNV